MLSKSRAHELAREALIFIASDEDLASDMLAASGMQADDLRSVAGSPDFGVFLLDYILQEDRRVLAFAKDQQIAPESVLHAREILSGLTPGAPLQAGDYD